MQIKIRGYDVGRIKIKLFKYCDEYDSYCAAKTYESALEHILEEIESEEISLEIFESIEEVPQEEWGSIMVDEKLKLSMKEILDLAIRAKAQFPKIYQLS